MMAQFMMDLKTDHRTSPSLYPPSSPKIHENYRPDSTDSGVLDLSSKRRDSVETRRTPSPYNSFSDAGSPPLHDSPVNSNNALLMNYHAMQRRELSPKTMLPYEPTNSLELRHTLPAGFHPGVTAYPIGHPIIPKQENLPHPPELASYLLQSRAMQHQHHQYSANPIHPARESDSLSESGSEGQLIPTVLKQAGNEAPNKPYPMVVGRDGKLARPFKAYPKDPLSLTSGFMASGSLLDPNSAEKYSMFRKRMLEQIHAANGGQATVSNPKMRRLNKSLSDASETESVPESRVPEPNEPHKLSNTHTTDESSKPCEVSQSSNGAMMNGSMVKDSAYFERRKKNNAAAKKSRDRRRIKEDEIAIRAAFLERENIELKFELAAARKQLALYGVTGSGSP